MVHCKGMDWGCSPDQAKQGHVPRVPSRHKGGEVLRHVDQDVHVADMVGHNNRCNIAQAFEKTSLKLI